jgi:hypothetical protein
MQNEHSPIDAELERQRDEEAQAEAKRLREQQVEDLKFVMGDHRGRRFVWRMLVEAGVYRSTFSESHAAMAFQEGKRNLGLLLVDDIVSECPGDYDRMRAEQRKA